VATVVDDHGDLGRYRPEIVRLQMAVLERKAAAAGRSQGVEGKVDCPETTAPRRGATHFCTAKIRNSGVGVVVVRQKDRPSNVDVTVRPRRLRTIAIERNILRALRKQGINAHVKCPSRVPSLKGRSFECEVKTAPNGRELTVVATQKDELGTFDLEVKQSPRR
jgi:hypothetical protein